MPMALTVGGEQVRFTRLIFLCALAMIGGCAHAFAQPPSKADKHTPPARKAQAAASGSVKPAPAPSKDLPAPAAQSLNGSWKVNWLQKNYVSTQLTISDLKAGDNAQVFDGQTNLLSGEKCPLRGVAANGVTALAPDAANGSQFGVLKIIKITADCEHGARLEFDLLGVNVINNPIGRATVVAKNGAREESAVSLTRPVQTP